MWEYIAATEPTGIGALGLDVASFVFQLISFVIVLVILKKLVFKKIVAVLDERARLVEKTITDIKEAEELKIHTKDAASIELNHARETSREIIEEARKNAAQLISEAEKTAEVKANELIASSQERMLVEAERLRREIATDTAELVALTTEKLLGSSTTKKDHDRLVANAAKELKK